MAQHSCKPTLSQILPRARVIPRLSIRADAPKKERDHRNALNDELTEIVVRAYRRHHNGSEVENLGEPMAVVMAPVRAQSAAEFYVSEKAFEMGLPQFRETLRDLSKAVDAILPSLPASSRDMLPPFTQLRALFCYGDPASNGSATEDETQFEMEVTREKLWEAHFSPHALRNVLATWQSMMKQLLEMTGRGRTPVTAKRHFVSLLAGYWTEELRLLIGNSRSIDEVDGDTSQKGLFANFVRAASKLIPADYQPQDGWDHVIRLEIESRENSPRNTELFSP